MSSQYLNQSIKNTTSIRVNNAQIDTALTVGANTGLNDTTFNGAVFKASTVFNQITSPTTTVDVNFQRNLIINTQTLTTPHSSNNSTSFLLTSYDATSATDIKVVRVNLLKYSGSTGLPIVVGKISNTDNNQYTITVINLHHNENLNGTIKLSVELVDFI
jgi:hypothetical protein